MESFMKKYLALFLVICISALLFVSCKGDKTPDNTSDDTSSGETTASSTPGSSTSETTTPPETTRVFTDTQIFDSLDYDYTVRTILDENGNITGVSVFTWKREKAADAIAFAEEYVINGQSYPIIQIGVGQGILGFQSQLKSITIPGSVLTISQSAFSFCTSLTTLNLSEGLRNINDMAFWNCPSLTSLSLPSTVKNIGKSAFSNCTSLTTLYIPAGVESIGDNAFAGCTSLTSVTIPRAFEGRISDIFPQLPANAVITYLD